MQSTKQAFIQAYKIETTKPGVFPYRYLLSTPPSYQTDPNKHFPLLLYLHGSGESHATDIELTKMHGIPRLVQAYENLKNGKPAPEKTQYKPENPTEDWDELPPVDLECARIVSEQFITVTPQVEPAPVTNEVDWYAEPLISLLDEIEKKYRVDKQRIYVTGNSMGGYGAFKLAAAQPERFAAVIPICGGAEPEIAPKIKNVPIWVFHGEKDWCVPFSESEKIVKALNNIGGNVRFTRYQYAYHDCWTETYNNKSIYDWLLEHKKTL